MITGSVIGVLFVSLVRRFLVEDPDLPFPESVAAAHIHKAGQMGAQTAGKAVQVARVSATSTATATPAATATATATRTATATPTATAEPSSPDLTTSQS